LLHRGGSALAGDLATGRCVVMPGVPSMDEVDEPGDHHQPQDHGGNQPGA
jgi:hypothetical protein